MEQGARYRQRQEGDHGHAPPEHPLPRLEDAQRLPQVVVLETEQVEVRLVVLHVATQPLDVRVGGGGEIALHETAAELDVGARRQMDRRRLVESPGGVNEAERLPVGCVECDFCQLSRNVVRERVDRVDLRCCIGLQPFFVDDDRLAEVEQRLTAKAMPMRVGEAAGHERHAHLATGGHREGDAGSAGLQPDQLAAGVADPLWKDAHAAPGLEHLEQPRERRLVARRIRVLRAQIHGHRSEGVEKRGHERIPPELGVRHEMDGPTTAHRGHDEPVHEGIGMVAREDDGPFGGHVLASDHLDSAEERVHHQADEPDENPIGRTDRAHNCGHYSPLLVSDPPVDAGDR